MYRVIAGATLDVKLVMMDADDAQRGALEHVICEMFPAAGPPTFLMCSFHVMTNVRKHTLKFSNHAKQLIYRHVYRIHYARTAADKDERIAEELSAWEMDSECKGFASYFKTQWLGDRYSKWQCLETTTGMAKTNNPVENFNRQLKTQHSLRRLLRLNPLFAELIKVSRIWSVLKVEFAVSPRAAPHIVRDYRKLCSAHKLQITRVSRGSISFLTGSGEFRVHQDTSDRTSEANSSIPPLDILNDFTGMRDARTSGVVSADTSVDRGLSVPTVHNADHPIELKLSDVDTENASDAQYEAEEQEIFGWAVDLENGNCTCRTMIKLGCCVHLMAVQDSLGLPFDGAAAPTRRVFPDKRRKKKHGRPTEVGHALSLS